MVNFFIKSSSFKEETSFIKFLTNFNFLLNNYTFSSKEKLVYNIQNNKKAVYLYNTHDKEEYKDKKNIIEATLLLKDNLKKLGINAVVENRKVSNFLSSSKDYYAISRQFLEEAIKKDKYAYYLDIHRDSETDTKIIINNQNYAKILFVLGLDNPNYQKNKEVLLKMNAYLNENYPGLSKGILEKSGAKVNGLYNQDIDENVLLIEIGGIENNIQEVNNSTEIIALMLYSMLGE